MIRLALVTTLLGLAGAAQAQAGATPAPAYPNPYPGGGVPVTTVTTTTTSAAPTSASQPLPPPRMAPEADEVPAPAPASPPTGAMSPAPAPPPAPGLVKRLSAPGGEPYPACACPVPYVVPPPIIYAMPAPPEPVDMAPPPGYGAPMEMDMVPPPPPPFPPPEMPVPPPPPPLQLAPAYAIDPVNEAVPVTVPPLPIDQHRLRARSLHVVEPRPDVSMAPVPTLGPGPMSTPAMPSERPARVGRDIATLDVFASRLRLDAGGPHELAETTIGGRARIGFAPGLFATGEYQKNGFDEANGRFDIRQVRAGLGARFLLSRELPSAWGTVEYTEWRLRDRFTPLGGAPDEVVATVRGPGLHVGTRLPLGPLVGIYGEGGYTWMQNGTYRVHGPEWLGGIDLIPLASRFASLKLFAEYRYSDMDFNFRDGATAQARGVPAENGLRLGDFRAGARIGLGR